MARCDKATFDFIGKVAGDAKLPEPAIAEGANKLNSNMDTRDTLRDVRLITNAIKNPAATLGKFVIRKATSDMIKESGMSVLEIYKYLNESYGKSWQDWEPETVWSTLGSAGYGLDDVLKNMVMALQTILKTNAVHEHWHIFENFGHAINANPVDFLVVQPVELNEIAWALYVMDKIRPGLQVDDDVYGYIAATAKMAGMVYLPKKLFPAKAQGFLDKMGNDEELRDEVKKLWDDGDTDNPEDIRSDIQLIRLTEIKDYVESNSREGT